MVECNLPKVKVAGSIPVSRFFILARKNPEIEHYHSIACEAAWSFQPAVQRPPFTTSAIPGYCGSSGSCLKLVPWKGSGNPSFKACARYFADAFAN